MNTADRSLSLVDYALRRRFAFVTLRPEYESGRFREHMLSKGASATLVDKIVDRMSKLNADIAADLTNLGPGFCIGHSFFAAVRPDDVLNDDWYRLIVLTEIVPLLEEYWSDNLSRVEEWRDRLLAD